MQKQNENHRIPETLFTKHRVHLEEILITGETLGLSKKTGQPKHTPRDSDMVYEAAASPCSASVSRPRGVYRNPAPGSAGERGKTSCICIKTASASSGSRNEIHIQINNHPKDNNEISPVAAHVHSVFFFFPKCLSLVKAIKYHCE